MEKLTKQQIEQIMKLVKDEFEKNVTAIGVCTVYSSEFWIEGQTSFFSKLENDLNEIVGDLNE